VLAEELTRAVHGEQGLAIARKSTEVLFGGSIDGLSAERLESIFANVPSASLSKESILGKPLFEVIALAGMVTSKGEARRLVQQGGLSLNSVKVSALERVFEEADLIEGRLALLAQRQEELLPVESVEEQKNPSPFGGGFFVV
jgi:tyrosyl-tRNA synthetase